MRYHFQISEAAASEKREFELQFKVNRRKTLVKVQGPLDLEAGDTAVGVPRLINYPLQVCLFQ